jgi:hypothetical protein
MPCAHINAHLFAPIESCHSVVTGISAYVLAVCVLAAELRTEIIVSVLDMILRH